MKKSRFYLLTAVALALGHWTAPATAGAAPSSSGLDEIPDTELATMRGRYTISDNTVAWFGVKMISTWKTASDQILQSTLAVNMDFTHDLPKVTFQPSVTITSVDAALPAPLAPASRSVTGAGLAHVGGVVQSVQVAGDDNLASNVTTLTVRDGNTAPPETTAAATGVDPNGTVAAAYGDGASAVASFDGGNARVLLTIEGQGAVMQWIRNGSIGQSVQLTTDNQWVSNRMEIELIRQATAINTQLAQNVAQAINLARTTGRIY